MCAEFRSRLDELFGVRELEFELLPAFGRYRRFFPEEAVRHPAKAYTDVLEYLVKTYTEPGDLILDPMAGSFSTCVVASLMGRNCIGVDIEERFYMWGLEAKRRVEEYGRHRPVGRMAVFRGDARMLGVLLGMHLGEIDAIITSPPYGDSLSKRRKGYTMVRQLAPTRQMMGTGDDNIANLPYGVIDAVITSPPYAHESTASKPTRLERLGVFRTGHSKEVKYTEDDYRRWSVRATGNIAKLKMFVRVPCRPEEADHHDTRPGRRGTLWEYTREVMVTVDNVEKIQGIKGPRRRRTETYVEAMLKVYGECYKVLRPGGKIIVIVKPFIRRKKAVDLPYHTHLMMERAGFRTVEVLKYRLKRQSFWRTLYYRRYPEVPRINHEYVVVAVKPG